MPTRTGVMLAKKANELYLSRMPGQVFTQPKLDGDRCKAIYRCGNDYQLVSSQGNDRSFSVPHIVEALNKLPCCYSLDGELYIHGVSHQKIRGMVSRTVNLHPDCDKIEYHIFDIVGDSGLLCLSQNQRLRILEDLREHISLPLKLVTTSLCLNHPDSLLNAMNFYIDGGYEGAIIRDPTATYEAKRTDVLLKMKPDQRDSARVIGFEEAISKEGIPKGMVGSFWVEQDNYIVEAHTNIKDVMTTSRREKVSFKVSAGRLTHGERITLWEGRNKCDPRRYICHYRYLMLTDDGKPREPTCVRLEIS